VAFGTPGGDPQDQRPLVFFLAHFYFVGLNLQVAIDAPMFHSNLFPSSFYPRAAAPGQVAVEDRLDPEVVAALRARPRRHRRRRLVAGTAVRGEPGSRERTAPGRRQPEGNARLRRRPLRQSGVAMVRQGPGQGADRHATEDTIARTTPRLSGRVQDAAPHRSSTAKGDRGRPSSAGWWPFRAEDVPLLQWRPRLRRGTAGNAALGNPGKEKNEWAG
jgi:hypothetical protein